MSRIVTAMERDGLVRIEPAREDARSIQITPTPRGKALLLAGKKRRVDSLAKALSSLDKEHLAEMEKAVIVLRDVIRSL